MKGGDLLSPPFFYRDPKLDNITDSKGQIMKEFKYSFIAASFLMAVFLSGCFDFEYRISIHNDGSAIISYKSLMAGIEPEALSGEDNDDNPLKEMFAEAKNEGFEVEVIKEGDKIGFKASKKIVDLRKAMEAGEDLGSVYNGVPFNPWDGLKIKKGIFSQELTVDTDIDLANLKSVNSTSDSMTEGIAEMIYSSSRFTFIMDLPEKPKDSNATKTENDGKTLIWVLEPGKSNPVSVKMVQANSGGYLLLGLGIAVALGIVGTAMARKRKK